MSFLDEIEFRLKAGDGGNGCVSFFRGPFIPKGGPDGGDGGRGGSIYLEATSNLQSLSDYRYRRHFKAQRAEDGRGKQQNGKGGKNLTIKLPLGTLIRDVEGHLLADLTEEGHRFLAAKGGKGGKGNIHFKSSVNQAPREATPGELGEEVHLQLELRSICDVAFVGFPNAGKSSLLRALSKAKPQVGAYPFTTINPQLGVFEHDDKRLIVADIPGLIEGAHQNKGLGHRFLRHISRSKCLVFLLALDSEEGLEKTLNSLKNELENYDPRLLEKESIVVINKSDLLHSEQLSELERQRLKKSYQEFKEAYPDSLLISAAQHDGLLTLGQVLEELVLPKSGSMLS